MMEEATSVIPVRRSTALTLSIAARHALGRVVLYAAFLAAFATRTAAQASASDPLPSWNAGPVKDAIVDFVNRVTKAGPDFVPHEDRIVTFDNDGTLWSEQPVYFELAFAIDRVKSTAASHPEWKNQQPFQGILDGDKEAVAGTGLQGLMQLIRVTHTGMTTDEFGQIVTDWLATSKHPRFQRPYTDLVFQPMLELLVYLRAHDFKTYIVSGGEVEFMRPWVEKVYGVPPEQVVGSSFKTSFELRGDEPVLVRLGDVDFINDGPGKPVAINQFIGRRPIAAFGNSDGDLQMLQWTAAGEGPRFGLLVHHTDADREWAYDRQSHFGRLDKALDEAGRRGWTVVDIKRDWKKVYGFEQ